MKKGPGQIYRFYSGAPFKIWQDLVKMLYITKLYIGTPPQLFRVAIDISWTGMLSYGYDRHLTEADLFIPSVHCEDAKYCNGYLKYNSTASTTSAPNGTNTTIQYGAMWTQGYLTKDTVYFAGLEIKEQLFEEATVMLEWSMFWDHAYDGVVGLSPTSATTDNNMSSPFSSIISQGLLNSNVFSIRLARPEYGELGETTMGGVNELYNRPFTRVPITTNLDPVFGGAWQVEASGLYLGDDGRIANLSLSNYTAVLATGYAFIDLPYQIGDKLRDALEPIEQVGLFDAVDCERRSKFPDLTVQLGRDSNVTVTAFDYLLEEEIENHGRWCLLAFFSSRYSQDRGHGVDENVIVLGSAFLGAFYVVYDWDRQEIGCGFAACSYQSSSSIRDRANQVILLVSKLR
ncbi:MAG: Vacuolar protease A [Piccolia ochrophora]|nr:MAG: Vacuolar protease A [Piccolia ochrophora]